MPSVIARPVRTASLAETNYDLISRVTRSVLNTAERYVGADEREEIEAEVAKALVECESRWPAYCSREGAEVTDNTHFRIWATRRLKGSIIDLWRKRSPLNRREIDHSTYALRHGMQEAADKFGVPLAEILEAVNRRQTLLVAEELSPEIVATQPYNLWDVLHRSIDQMPLIARTWIVLVFVQGMSIRDARIAVGLSRDHRTAMALQGYVEYTLVRALLTGGVHPIVAAA